MKSQLLWIILASVLPGMVAHSADAFGPKPPSGSEQTMGPITALELAKNEKAAGVAQQEIKVLYAGDSGIVMGPHIIASPLNYESKGAEVHIWCQQVLDALNGQPDINVRYLTTWAAFESFPETPEELAEYDVVVLSDIEWEVLVLYPWSRFMDAPMGPNRLASIREYVKNGGSLLMIGGWSSFTGRKGMGGYRGTPVEEALPVYCLDVNDDRREAPEGVRIVALHPEHPTVNGLDWEGGPIFTGYNFSYIFILQQR